MRPGRLRSTLSHAAIYPGAPTRPGRRPTRRVWSSRSAHDHHASFRLTGRKSAARNLRNRCRGAAAVASSGARRGSVGVAGIKRDSRHDEIGHLARTHRYGAFRQGERLAAGHPPGTQATTASPFHCGCRVLSGFACTNSRQFARCRRLVAALAGTAQGGRLSGLSAAGLRRLAATARRGLMAGSVAGRGDFRVVRRRFGKSFKFGRRGDAVRSRPREPLGRGQAAATRPAVGGRAAAAQAPFARKPAARGLRGDGESDRTDQQPCQKECCQRRSSDRPQSSYGPATVHSSTVLNCRCRGVHLADTTAYRHRPPHDKQPSGDCRPAGKNPDCPEQVFIYDNFISP